MALDSSTADHWRVLASVGAGYAVATGLLFVLFFLLPYAVVRAL